MSVLVAKENLYSYFVLKHLNGRNIPKGFILQCSWNLMNIFTYVDNGDIFVKFH